MKIRIDGDHRFIFFRAPDKAAHGLRIEVPDEVVKKWERILEEFHQMQDEMERFYEKE